MKKLTYAQRIKKITIERGVSIQSAKLFYNKVLKNDRYRIRRFAINDMRRKPSYVKAKDVRKFGKLVSKGREKGFTIFYVDTLLQKIVDAHYALKLRKVLMVNRFTIYLVEIPKSKQRAFLKFWPKRALKRKTKPTFLTESEARQVAKKVVAQFYKDDRLFESLKRIFYYG